MQTSRTATNSSRIALFGLCLKGETDWLFDLSCFYTPKELLAAKRLPTKKAAHSFLAGRILAHAVLLSFTDNGCSDFAKTPFGKPFLPEGGVYFSLAHTEGYVALAVSTACPLGLDLELLRPQQELSSCLTILHPKEASAIRQQHDQEKAWWRCWTRKEALLKAIGQGFYLSPKSFLVDCSEKSENWLSSLPPCPKEGWLCDGDTRVLAPNDANAWTSLDLDVDQGYQASIVCTQAGCRPSAFFLVGQAMLFSRALSPCHTDFSAF